MKMYDSTGEAVPLVADQINDRLAHNETSEPEPMSDAKYVFFTAFVIFILFSVLSQTTFIVQPGMIGLVVTLGKVVAVESGFHYKYPFISKVIMFSAKTQKLEESNNTPTKEGLSVQLDTAILFRLDPSKAADIYREVGEDFIHTLLEPEAASAVRGLTSESDAKALYSSGRNLIQDSVKAELVNKLTPRGIIVDDVLLKDLVLPSQLTAAIEAKVQAEQEAARMQFVLQKEKQEAERKSIEAGGIAEFQRIVSDGISPNLLKWKGVEATEKFAASSNTKIIIVGNDANGLPVLLNSDQGSGEQS